MSDDALSRVCLACGLCCDGSLFDFVALDPGEEIDGASRLPLPCARLEGKCCTRYAERPSGCRSFVCALGRALQAGQLTEDDALTQVGLSQVAIAELGTTLGLTDAIMAGARQAMADSALPLPEVQRAQVLSVNRQLRQRFFGWTSSVRAGAMTAQA